MKKHRIIIAGSRICPEIDDDLVVNIHRLTINMQCVDMEIVSGTCKGADKLGEYFATQYGLSIKQFPADWDNNGKSAGYIRNKKMAEYATHLIALWDGKSKGTKHMIDLAKEKGLKIRVITI